MTAGCVKPVFLTRGMERVYTHSSVSSSMSSVSVCMSVRLSVTPLYSMKTNEFVGSCVFRHAAGIAAWTLEIRYHIRQIIAKTTSKVVERDGV